jgi:hypothetical protein
MPSMTPGTERLERAAERWLPERVRRPLAAGLGLARRPQARRAALALAIFIAAAVYVRMMLDPYRGDAYGYWLAPRYDHLYNTAVLDAPHGYLYSPAFLQALWPFLSLPWELFYALWLGVMMVATVWVCRPWLSILILPWVFITFGIPLLQIPRHSLSSANVYFFMGLAVVASFRWPWTYSVLFLTKVTPGIGALWFLVRREWSNLAIALGATAAISAVSFVLAPGWWFDWFTVLRNNSSYPEPAFAIHFLPLITRLAIAVLMIVVAARFDARWVLPIATVLAMPYIADTALIILVCVAPLLRRDAWTQSPSRQPTEPEPALAGALAS